MAGRSTRSDRHVPRAAIGGSTACSRTVKSPAAQAGSCPSTHGCASSRRRPTDSARRCANRRTAASSAKRTALRRKPVSVVDPHRIGRGDQHVGGAVGTQQRLEDARPGELGLQYPQVAQHLGIAKHTTGFRADGRRDHVRSKRCGLGRQPLPDPVDQRGGHFATPHGPAGDAAPSSTFLAADASGDRRRSRSPPCLEHGRDARLCPHRGQRRHPHDLRHVGRTEPAGRRSADDETDVRIGRHQPLGGGRRCGAGPYVGGREQNHQIGGVQRGFHRRGASSRQVADDRGACAPARVHHRTECHRVDVAGSAARGQHRHAIACREAHRAVPRSPTVRPATPGRASAARRRLPHRARDRCRRPTDRRRRAAPRMRRRRAPSRTPRRPHHRAHRSRRGPRRGARPAATRRRRRVRRRDRPRSPAGRAPAARRRRSPPPTALAAALRGRSGIRGRDGAEPSSTQRPAVSASSTTAEAASHTLRLDGSDAWTTRTPTAAPTRSTSLRSSASATSARTPPLVFMAPLWRGSGDTSPCRPCHGAICGRKRICARMRDCAPSCRKRSFRKRADRGEFGVKRPQKRDDPRQGGRRRRSSCISPGGSG